jgi:TolB-like protein/class 3 adenylate cyclase
MPPVRRLTAILAADVAGYSRLMGADEEGTHERLQAHFQELVNPKIAEHRGRIVKNTGDGFLAEFGSVVDAVRCAVEVQCGMIDREPKMPDERRIRFRIGISLGDVIVEEHDIFGDGVNVAARLEALAEPGGICVSRMVRDQIRDKLPYPLEDRGEQQVKNIARPVRAYRVRNRPAPVEQPLPASPPSLPLPDKPSIALLPFQNMSGDPEQEYFADGMVEEIITALSRIRWLFVIARNSSFTYKGQAVEAKQVGRELGVRYVLEGSMRKADNRVRITGQLIDVTSGARIWADRFDGTLDDIFELQDQIASGVVAAIEPKLVWSEIKRAIRKPTENLDAYDLYLRALAQFNRWTIKGSREAIDLLRKALALDPAYAAAFGLFASCRVFQQAHSAASDEEVAEGVRFARRAVETGWEDPDALQMGGWGIFNLSGERASGLSAIERALALNPNSAHAWNISGWAHAFCNRPAEAIEAIHKAIRLSPVDPHRWSFDGGLALAHLVAGRYEQAIDWANRALDAQFRAAAVIGYKAVACGHLGRVEEGHASIKRLRELRPGFTVTRAERALGKSAAPEVLAIFLEGYRKAGMPEE